MPVAFTGTVTNSVTDEIFVIDSNGDRVRYTGPVPDYPFDTGDTITIGFDAIVPSSQAIANGLVPQSSDGIYRFQIGPRPEELGNFPGTASFNNFQGNSGISDIGEYATDGGLTIVYDANTDSYAIDPGQAVPSGDTFSIGSFDIPVLTFDTQTSLVSVLLNSQLLGVDATTGIWSGNGATTGRIPVGVANFNGTDFVGTTGSAVSQITFSGGWNLPIFGSSDPVEVPAPPMLVLFGLAAFALLRRRSKPLAELKST